MDCFPRVVFRCFHQVSLRRLSAGKEGQTRMAILINLDVMMAKRKIGLTELSDKVGISLANLSILKNNRARAVRFSTLDAICRALDCQPGDLLEYAEEEDDETENETENPPKKNMEG